MKSTIIALFMSTIAITACGPVDPQQAQTRRDALKTQIFPNPADRNGIYLAFAMESGGIPSQVELIYFPDQVSESDLTQRMTAYCSRFKSETVSGQAFIRKRGADSVRTDSSGVQRPVKQIYYSCFKPRA